MNWLLSAILFETLLCVLSLAIVLRVLLTIRQLLADILRELRNK